MHPKTSEAHVPWHKTIILITIPFKIYFSAAEKCKLVVQKQFVVTTVSVAIQWFRDPISSLKLVINFVHDGCSFARFLESPSCIVASKLAKYKMCPC